MVPPSKLSCTFTKGSRGTCGFGGRHAHNAIYDGSTVLVVGGNGTFKTEKCTISNNQMNCTEQNPQLSSYAYYPEMFMVSTDYCKSLP